MILNKLKELGLDENTLIIWTTDHGDGLACHGGHFDKGSYMCEEVLRIPFAMKWKGVIPAGQVRDELISTIDFPVSLVRCSRNEIYQKSSRWAKHIAIGNRKTGKMERRSDE